MQSYSKYFFPVLSLSWIVWDGNYFCSVPCSPDPPVEFKWRNDFRLPGLCSLDLKYVPSAVRYWGLDFEWVLWSCGGVTGQQAGPVSISLLIRCYPSTVAAVGVEPRAVQSEILPAKREIKPLPCLWRHTSGLHKRLQMGGLGNSDLNASSSALCAFLSEKGILSCLLEG